MTANISGGHLNPAVTLALCSAGLISVPKSLMYIAAQLLGAIAGAALADAVTPGSLLGYNAVSPNISAAQACGAEFLLTFVLVFVVFKSAVDTTMDPGFAPALIGFSVFAIHLTGITIDGTSVNPARSFGASVISGEWPNHWVFWVGPIAGGLAASLVFKAFKLAENTCKKDI